MNSIQGGRPRPSLGKRLRGQWILQVIILGGLVYLLLFNYLPMSGILIAFRKYKLKAGIAGFFTSEWVGLKWFKEFMSDYTFPILIKNTVGLSALKIVCVFPVPIVFALLLNELRTGPFKRVVQTASYLPHFISWVIVSGILYAFFGSNFGMINELLKRLGWIDEAIPIMTSAKYYWGMAILSDIWKSCGWSAIIYIAAIAGIDPTLYEAAEIDGAGRLRKIWHITLTGIRSTVIIMLILSLGSIASGNFDQAYLLGNATNYDASEIVGTYVMDVGLVNRRYDYAAAVGLLQSVVSVILVFGANLFSRRVLHTGLY